MPIPIGCRSIADEIKAIRQKRASVQSGLSSAGPGKKAAIAGELKALAKEIAARQRELQIGDVKEGISYPCLARDRFRGRPAQSPKARGA
jgi:hypothetical protein